MLLSKGPIPARLGDAKPMLVKAFGRTFEQMAWSADSTRVALIANTIQGREFVKRVLVYQRGQMTEQSSALPPVESVTLGRPNNLLLSAIASNQATVFVERSGPPAPPASRPRYTIDRWPIRTLRAEVDAAADDEPPAPAAPAGTATRVP